MPGGPFPEALSVDREIGATADVAWDQIELAGGRIVTGRWIGRREHRAVRYR